MQTVEFHGYKLTVNLLNYGNNGRPALLLESLSPDSPPLDDDPECDEGCNDPFEIAASVNLVHEPMGADEIAIKDYSENTGVLRVLVDAGVVSEPVRWARSGFVEIPICKLLVTA